MQRFMVFVTGAIVALPWRCNRPCWSRQLSGRDIQAEGRRRTERIGSECAAPMQTSSRVASHLDALKDQALLPK